MIFYIFATRTEAAPFIELTKSGKLETGSSVNGAAKLGPSLWKTSKGNIIGICGIGPQAAKENTEELLSLSNSTDCCLTVINCGICGSLNEKHSIGDICLVTKVLKGDAVLGLDVSTNDYESIGIEEIDIISIDTEQDCRLKEQLSSLPGATLATTSTGVFGGHPKKELSKVADIVDMEGYAIAQICRRIDVPLLIIKGVSDFADSGGKEAIQTNIQGLSQKMAQLLIKTEE